MPTYKTPGVYVEEISVFPPSVAAVETAIPVFIGYTEKAADAQGNSLAGIPTRITSLLEFAQYFGGAEIKPLDVNVDQVGNVTTVSFDTAPGLPDHFLFYSMQLFFANGGGPCYILSIGDYVVAADVDHFLGDAGPPIIPNVFITLESYDEPTLLVFPDACLLSDVSHGDVVDAALSHCNKMQDRFTIADVRNALPGQTDDNTDVTNNFRAQVAGDLTLVKYGAAYFPYVRTSLSWRTDETQILIKAHTVDGAAGPIAPDATLDSIKTTDTAAYNAIKQFIATETVTIPPSGGVAGVYARVDASRGVWKAPANASLLGVIEPTIKITNDLNDGLNIDATSGKSVNAIRTFTGKGTLVWGARTLAGNDNENRYVPVRRFLIFAEESIKKATAFFVFEPNDANTWNKARSMIESFLTRQWRDGALAGEKPEHAFDVAIGLNKTMTAQDILDGYMIVEIRLAIVRPAEFIVLRFAQKLQES
jgi:Bacteriophage tail sheath protein